MSPLHSGQEDKRGRRGWDRYLEGEEGLRRERKEKCVASSSIFLSLFFFFFFFIRKVDCCLDEQGSTVVHQQENRDSFFGPWTDKSAHQSRRSAPSSSDPPALLYNTGTFLSENSNLFFPQNLPVGCPRLTSSLQLV